jgi:hypothetical protein
MSYEAIGICWSMLALVALLAGAFCAYAHKRDDQPGDQT